MKLDLKFEKIKLPINYDNATPSQRRIVREEYIRVQKGLCHFCKCPLDKNPPSRITKLKLVRGAFPRGFWKYPVHLHHSHVTGLTIGAVHNYCNAVLWQYHGE